MSADRGFDPLRLAEKFRIGEGPGEENGTGLPWLLAGQHASCVSVGVQLKPRNHNGQSVWTSKASAAWRCEQHAQLDMPVSLLRIRHHSALILLHCSAA